LEYREINTADSRQHPIEQDDVWHGCLDSRVRGLSVMRFDADMTFTRQRKFKHVSYCGFVIDN
jgi:hypothetical protein